MTLKDFIITKCQDILERKSLLCLDNTSDDNSIYSYDDLLQDSYGNFEKVVYDDNSIPIKINDIVELPLEDFKRVYPAKSSIDAYTKYLSAFKMIYGKELLTMYFSEIEKSMQQLNDYNVTLNVLDLKNDLGLTW